MNQKPPVKSYCGGKPNYCEPTEWVGLTTEEIKTIVDSATSDNDGYDIFTDGEQVAFLVEAKLKEKNT